MYTSCPLPRDREVGGLSRVTSTYRWDVDGLSQRIGHGHAAHYRSGIDFELIERPHRRRELDVVRSQRREGVDVYDERTDFTPFRARV